MTTATPPRPPVGPQAGAQRKISPPMPTTARTLDPFRVLRRHLVLILGSTVVGVALGFVAFVLFLLFLPLYSAEVVFEIRAGLEEGSDSTAGDIEREETVVRLATTEMYLLNSRPVLQAAVKEPDVRGTAWYTANFEGKIDEAVDELEEDLRTRMVAGSNLFTLTWSTGTASDVPIVLDALKTAYLEQRRELDTATYNTNLEVFRSQLNSVTRNLEDLSQEIEAFIREKGITDIDNPKSNQLALAQVMLLQQRGESGTSLNLAQNMYMQTAAKLEGTVVPTEEDRRTAEMDPTVRPHELAMLNTKTALHALRDQYLDPDHPLILKAELNLRATEAEYEKKITEIMAKNLQAQLKALGTQIETFRNMLDGIEEEYEQNDALLRTLAADMSRYREMEDQRELLQRQRDATLV